MLAEASPTAHMQNLKQGKGRRGVASSSIKVTRKDRTISRDQSFYKLTLILTFPSAMDIQYLRSAITNYAHRPIIHHLNADTSWLLQLPIPDAQPGDSGRKYYNILIDPWLSGSQSDVASWFSQQWHAIPSAYQSIADIQDLCCTVESLAKGNDTPKAVKAKQGESLIDAVAISHEFTDHCHKQTLMELPKSTPVYAWSKAAGLIKGFKWFERVVEIPAFNKDWRETSVGEYRDKWNPVIQHEGDREWQN